MKTLLKIVADATLGNPVVKRFLLVHLDRLNRPSTASGPRRHASNSPAAALRRTREAHSQETAQDYVELIADLIAETGEARAIDLAHRLGVTHVTVGRTIQRLARDGLVTAQPYRSIFLTDAGRALAEESRRRHEIVCDFLRALGIPEKAVESDAEGIEHHVSPETLAAFQRFLGGKKQGRR